MSSKWQLTVGNDTLSTGDVIKISTRTHHALRQTNKVYAGNNTDLPRPDRTREMQVEVLNDGVSVRLIGALGPEAHYLMMSADHQLVLDDKSVNPFQRTLDDNGGKPLSRNYGFRLQAYPSNASWFYVQVVDDDGMSWYMGSQGSADGSSDMVRFFPALIAGGATSPPDSNASGDGAEAGGAWNFIFYLDTLSSTTTDRIIATKLTGSPTSQLVTEDMQFGGSSVYLFPNPGSKPLSFPDGVYRQTFSEETQWSASYHWDVGLSISTKVNFTVGMVGGEVSVTFDTSFGGSTHSGSSKTITHDFMNPPFTVEPGSIVSFTCTVDKTVVLQPIQTTLERLIVMRDGTHDRIEVSIPASLKYVGGVPRYTMSQQTKPLGASA